MAKFDFNRTTGGTLELVRDANGNYSVNKVGFTRLPALNLPDLTGSTTITPPDATTPPDPTPDDETIEGQTAQAFQTGDDERKDFTNESMLKTAAQTSKLLTSSYDTRVEDETFADRSLKIKSPTESISGYDDAYIEDQKRKESGQYNLDDLLMDLPEDTRVKDENIIIPLRKPDGEVKKKYNLLEETNKIMDSLKGDRFKQGTDFNNPVGGLDQIAKEVENLEATKPNQIVTVDQLQGSLKDLYKNKLGYSGDTKLNIVPDDINFKTLPKETLGISTPSTEQFQRQTTLPTQVDTQNAIGDYMDESVYSTGKTLGIGTSIPDPEQFRRQTTLPPETPKKSALETVNTSLKKVFETFSPIGALAREIGRPINEGEGTVAFNNSYFQTRGDLGSSTDSGRIVGNPSTKLYAGMNSVSKFGNLEKAGAKRIATREATIARKGIKSASNPNGVSQSFVDNTNNMKKEQDDYRNKKNNHNIDYAKKKGVDTTKLNPNEMRNVAESGDPGGSGGGKTKIVCTMMNESYGFGSFRNKIWMKFHGNIAPEYQKGYHKLFLPLVNYAKQKGITNKIIKNILEHIAVHSTIDMRQTLRGKRHTLGRLYRKVILPLCYWAGKK